MTGLFLLFVAGHATAHFSVRVVVLDRPQIFTSGRVTTYVF